jgi:hypothetical protein
MANAGAKRGYRGRAMANTGAKRGYRGRAMANAGAKRGYQERAMANTGAKRGYQGLRWPVNGHPTADRCVSGRPHSGGEGQKKK